jgi:hypothetical protein
MIIGISGKIGSGKDTVGKIIQFLTILNKSDKVHCNMWKFHFDKNNNAITSILNESDYEIKKFADTLKDMVCILISCTREQLEDHDFKNKELGEQWRIWYIIHYKLSNNNNEGRIGKIYSSKEALLGYESSDFFKNLKLNGYQIVSKVLTPRLLLQLLGTNCGRDIIHPNIWVNSLFSEYNNTWRALDIMNMSNNSVKRISEISESNWIITDMRFPNELEAVKSRGGINIRVNRFKEPLYDYLGDKLTLKELFHQIHKDTGEYPLKTYADEHWLIKEHESETALDNAEFDYTIDNNGNIEDLIEKIKKILIKEKIINA